MGREQADWHHTQSRNDAENDPEDMLAGNYDVNANLMDRGKSKARAARAEMDEDEEQRRPSDGRRTDTSRTSSKGWRWGGKTCAREIAHANGIEMNVPGNYEAS